MPARSRFSQSSRRAAGEARPRSLARSLIAMAIAVLAVGCGSAGSAGPGQSAASAAAPPAAAAIRPVLPVPVSPAELAALPLATTAGTTPKAPRDVAPFAAETGIVLHPIAIRVVYTRPGGPAAAALPVTEIGSQTWVPVVQSRPGWDRVLLPTRPNESTGWIYLGGGGLQTAYTPYRVEVSLAAYRLTLLDSGHRLGSWTVAEGATGTPTPAGRTFLLASLAPRYPTYSPLILPLGVHSDTLSAFGGGPGTVALHGWPDPAVFGRAVSHGCVRVPAAALRALSLVPLGTPVMIVS